MDNVELNKALEDFATFVISESKKNLSKLGKNSSGDLANSLGYNINFSENSFQLDITGEDYLKFQDQGVSGTIKKHNTPFKYTNKKPPLRFLVTWLKRKKGVFRFKDQKSQAFAVQNTIFKYGIKPSKFFTTPFERAFESLPDELVEAYGLDIEDFLNFTLNKI